MALQRSEARVHTIEGVTVADSFAKRLVGLMGREDLSAAFLLIPHCRALQTSFMRGPIDVAFLDDRCIVVDARSGIPPWRLISARGRAVSALEMPAGYLKAHAIQIGDVIRCP